ncbi:hypothetical protein GLOIN_2v1763773 [Rhizophagus clarus]|uniref:Uncharacterized protein n=1 Tax=Rhizophagus clarus TaxID=94130 RepID=A0A8H3QJD5_9GLOM|nr:hypothetical protein GLOIN_2v1763773 [Rhizophagus clarus]
MAGIATRYVTENEFNTEMSIKELRYNFSEEQVFALISELTASQKKGEALLNAPDTPNITQEAEIDTERNKQCEDEGIYYPDYSSLELVKERLDVYDKAISSGQLRDSGKSGALWFNIFLKKNEFLSEIGKPLLPSSLHKLGTVFTVVSYGAKNLSEAMTIASKALRHSPENHASSAKNYTIVNYRLRGEPYDQADAFKLFDEN